jgi:sulfur-oxidizing protein SoxY
MNQSRRKFLKTATYVGATTAALSAGVLIPQRVLGAYNKAAFEAKDVNSALSAAMGSDQHSASDQIKMKAPDIAENGAVVPITVDAGIDGVDSIGIIIAGNASPLSSTYSLAAGTEAYVSTRVKMAQTSDVIAVVKANGKLYSATKEVKVTIGGCGG